MNNDTPQAAGVFKKRKGVKLPVEGEDDTVHCITRIIFIYEQSDSVKMKEYAVEEPIRSEEKLSRIPSFYRYHTLYE